MVQLPRCRHFYRSNALLFFNPFTQVASIKACFAQQVHLGKQAVPPPTEQSSNSEFTPVLGLEDKDKVLSAITSIFDLPKHVEKVVSELPSFHNKVIKCEKDPIGISNCTWPVNEWFPSPGGNTSSGWVTGNTKWADDKTSQAIIRVRGTNAQGCRIYPNQLIYDYKVWPLMVIGGTGPSRMDMRYHLRVSLLSSCGAGCGIRSLRQRSCLGLRVSTQGLC